MHWLSILAGSLYQRHPDMSVGHVSQRNPTRLFFPEILISERVSSAELSQLSAASKFAPFYQQSDTARLTAVPIYSCPSRRSHQMSPTASIASDYDSNCLAQGQATPNVPGALSDYAVSVGVVSKGS